MDGELNLTDVSEKWLADLPVSENSMSNFDHQIDDGMEADLRGGMCSSHAAWDFHGTVWYDPDRGRFCELVHRYRAPVGVYAAPTLKELMAEVNDEWGWD